MDYESIDELMREPENKELTRYQVFKKGFETVPHRTIWDNYAEFKSQIELDKGRIPDICYFRHYQMELIKIKDQQKNGNYN